MIASQWAPHGLERGKNYCDYLKNPMISPNRRYPKDHANICTEMDYIYNEAYIIGSEKVFFILIYLEGGYLNHSERNPFIFI